MDADATGAADHAARVIAKPCAYSVFWPLCKWFLSRFDLVPTRGQFILRT